MNDKKLILYIFVLGIFMNMALIASASPPPQPAIVYGDFDYSLGNPVVASGVDVVVKISGITYKTTTTIESNKYFIQIPTDNSDTAGTKEGGASGDVLEFYFDGVIANETLLWPGEAATVIQNFYVHHVPVLGAIGDKSVDEISLLTFTISATDIDADSIVYSATGLPTGATIGSSNGVFSWTPTYEQSRTYDVTFTASDGDSSTLDVSETIIITVYNVSGSIVSVLTDNYYRNGKHVIQWKASDLPAGYYFYSIQTSTGTETKKASIVK